MATRARAKRVPAEVAEPHVRKPSMPEQKRLLAKFEAQRGYNAQRKNQPVWANPYPADQPGYPKHELWCFGFWFSVWERYGCISPQEAGVPGDYCCRATSLGPGV